MESKKTILVVDDEPDAIKFVEAVLSNVGDYTVISSSDGPDCLQRVQEETPDLIILDIMMPEMDGFKVFYELRNNASTKDIPIIMLTGVADKVGIRFFKKDMKDYMGSEPAEYIEKPLDPAKLQDAVQWVFETYPV